MRALTLAIPVSLLVLLGSASAALPQGDSLVAIGWVQFSGHSCKHDLAQLVIERGYGPEEELIYVGTGTGFLTFGSTDPTIAWNYVPFQACGNGWFHFGGGQCFSCEGSCRILADGTAECWSSGGGEVNEPDPEHRGRYLRLDPDGTFYFSYRFANSPWDPDFEIHGLLKRV